MRAISLLVLAWSAAADAQPAYTAKVDVVDKKGEQHAVLASKLTCATPAKCPEWSLDLGRVDSATLVGVVDLYGAPHAVRDLPSSLPESAKLPAAFVIIGDVDGAGTKWTRLAAVSLEGGRAKLIWRGEIAMTKKGTAEGFAVTGEVALVATEPGKPLAIEYTLRTILPPTTKRNGPSVQARFVMHDGTYQRSH